MTRGQIFAADFLIAMTLIIVALGTIAGLGEFNSYAEKQKVNYITLTQKAQTAAITLADSNWSTCDFNSINPSYSVDISKINSIILAPEGAREIKKRLAITDTNAVITLSPIFSGPAITILQEAISGKNSVTIDLNVMQCSGNQDFNALLQCLKNDPSCSGATPKLSKLSVTVSK